MNSGTLYCWSRTKNFDWYSRIKLRTRLVWFFSLPWYTVPHASIVVSSTSLVSAVIFQHGFEQKAYLVPWAFVPGHKLPFHPGVHQPVALLVFCLVLVILLVLESRFLRLFICCSIPQIAPVVFLQRSKVVITRGSSWSLNFFLIACHSMQASSCHGVPNLVLAVMLCSCCIILAVVTFLSTCLFMRTVHSSSSSSCR